MPGAGVTLDTIDEILAQVPVGEVHSSCSVTTAVEDEQLIALGFSAKKIKKTDTAVVRALKARLSAR